MENPQIFGNSATYLKLLKVKGGKEMQGNKKYFEHDTKNLTSKFMGYRENNAMLRGKFHLYRVLLDIVKPNNHIKTVFTTTGRTFKPTSRGSCRELRDSCEGKE